MQAEKLLGVVSAEPWPGGLRGLVDRLESGKYVMADYVMADDEGPSFGTPAKTEKGWT